MKEPQRYSSLKRAMQRQNGKSRLPTNFTFTTMQRVIEVNAAREKRENRIVFFATIVASLLLIAGSAYIIAPMVENYRFSMHEHIKTLNINSETIEMYLPIFAAVILLLLLEIRLQAILKRKLKE
jgi:TRAP-type C4-dicarboxylate transport system permease small subunit